jgi:hypothetical protein
VTVTWFHLADPAVGHERSTDCWCEPIIDWYHDQDGRVVVFVAHVDLEAEPSGHVVHHHVTLARRAARPDWITEVLDRVT